MVAVKRKFLRFDDDNQSEECIFDGAEGSQSI